VERETQLVAGDAGFECQGLGSLQQALERTKKLRPYLLDEKNGK
jgi:hypothetical protein